MRSLFELIGYEYKKMFARKGTVIAVVLALMLTCFAQVMLLTPGFTANYTPWELMTRSRSYARAISGRIIDEALISAAHYDISNRDPLQGPYADIFWITQNTRGMWDLPEAEGITDFYELNRISVLRGAEWLVSQNHMPYQAVDWIMAQYDSIPTPWVFEYYGGYYNFFTRLSIVTVILFFALAVGIAPIFATEHRTGVAQLILASKYGKSKLIRAKLIAAASFCVGLTIVLLLSGFIVCMAVFGRDGGAAVFQLYWHVTPYNFNMRQVTAIYFVNAALRGMFFGAVLLFLSSKLKSSFGVMIIASVWIMVALAFIIPLPSIWLGNIVRLVVQILPAMVNPTRSVFANVPYEVFGVFFPPFVFEPVFNLAVGVLAMFFAGWVFRRYQVV